MHGVSTRRNSEGRPVKSAYLPRSFQSILDGFAGCFTTPTYANFCTLACGWVLCQGLHTVSGAVTAALAWGITERHHSTFYYFFSRAVWDPDKLGCALFKLLRPFLPDRIVLAVDDTLCKRCGPQIFGAGMHHDASTSTYGGGGGARVNLAFGHNWVVLSVWVPLPWDPLRGKAVPILFRLYRNKKNCKDGEYRKRTELAAAMLRVVSHWLPGGSEADVLGDQEYGCRTVLRALPEGFHYHGAFSMRAALYDPKPAAYKGKGRRPIKGRRLASPGETARAWETDGRTRRRWKKTRLVLYGREVELWVRTFVATWYSVTGTRRLRIVITRDPRGRYEPRAFFSTLIDLSAAQVLQAVSRRWPLEVAFRDAKQILGADEARNGWWRRPDGERRPPRKAGPQGDDERGGKAVRRTAPFVFIVYGIVLAWYLRHGKPERDVALVRRHRAWYTQKTTPSFADMIAALRRSFGHRRVSQHPLLRTVRAKLGTIIPMWGVPA
jgi:DDE superfamily endonuclease